MIVTPRLLCSVVLIAASILPATTYGFEGASKGFLDFIAIREKKYQLLRENNKVQTEDQLRRWHADHGTIPWIEKKTKRPLQSESLQLEKDYQALLSKAKNLQQPERDWILRLARLDTQTKWSTKSRGYGLKKGTSYVTSLGLEIDESCLKEIDLILKGLPRRSSRTADWAERFGVTLEKKLHAITDQMESCSKRHPEVSPMIEQWFSALKNTRITCVNQDAHVYGFAGFASPTGTITLARNIWYPLISPDSSTLDAIQDGHSAESILVHEIFHYTDANNALLPHHNHPSPLQESCDAEARAADRVYSLPNLCLGKPIETLTFSNKHTRSRYEEIAKRRIDQCGIQKGCIDIWTETHPLYGIAGISKGISHSQAERLCTRLYEEGSCLTENRIQGMDPVYSGVRFTDPEYTQSLLKLAKILPTDSSPYSRLARLSGPQLLTDDTILREVVFEIYGHSPPAEIQKLLKLSRKHSPFSPEYECPHDQVFKRALEEKLSGLVPSEQPLPSCS